MRVSGGERLGQTLAPIASVTDPDLLLTHDTVWNLVLFIAVQSDVKLGKKEITTHMRKSSTLVSFL